MKSATAAVLATLANPNYQLSQRTRILRELLLAEHYGQWRTLAELSVESCMPLTSAGSRLRDLRQVGFVIKKAKRRSRPVAWEYMLFSSQA